MAFQFTGFIDDEGRKPSTNEIWAFTPGTLDDRGWLSEKAGGGDMGLYGELQTGVKSSKQVLLAVPFLGNRTERFRDFLTPTRQAGIFNIFIWDPDIKKFLIKILLKGVTVQDLTSMNFRQIEERASYNVFKLSVDDIDWGAP